MFLGYGLASWLLIGVAFVAAHALYAAVTFAIARWYRLIVDEVGIGYGPPLIRWMGDKTELRLAPILIGSYVKFSSDEPLRTETAQGMLFSELPVMPKILLLLGGHLLTFLVGVAVIYVNRPNRLGVQLGLMFAGMGMLNLMPLPSISGGQALLELLAAVIGKTPRAWIFDQPNRMQAFTVLTVLSVPVFWFAMGSMLYVIFARYDDLGIWLRRWDVPV